MVGMSQKLLGSSHLKGAALMHYGDTIGHDERFSHVVGHHHNGQSQRPLQRLELRLKGIASHRI
jgi:hypothetical protein